MSTQINSQDLDDVLAEADKLIHDGTTRVTGFNIVGVLPGSKPDDK